MTVSSEVLLEEIDVQTSPDRMSKQDALDTLEDLIDGLRSRCEALRGELRDEPE